MLCEWTDTHAHTHTHTFIFMHTVRHTLLRFTDKVTLTNTIIYTRILTCTWMYFLPPSLSHNTPSFSLTHSLFLSLYLTLSLPLSLSLPLYLSLSLTLSLPLSLLHSSSLTLPLSLFLSLSSWLHSKVLSPSLEHCAIRLGIRDCLRPSATQLCLPKTQRALWLNSELPLKRHNPACKTLRLGETCCLWIRLVLRRMVKWQNIAKGHSKVSHREA